MLRLDGAGTSCNYSMCTNAGHASCDVVAQHYSRLCAAAQAVVDDPTPENRAALQAVLDEEVGLEG